MRSWLRPLARGLTALFGRRQADAEVNAEIEHFLEESAREHEQRGLSRDEARRAARVELGSALSVRQQVRSSGWESFALGFVEDVWRGVRTHRRHPWFTAGTVLVLALGVGANAAVWSLLHATMFRPLPYEDPDRLVVLWAASPRAPETRGGLTGEWINAWRLQSQELFSGFAAVQAWRASLEAQLDLVLDERTERLRGALVTPEFFEVLGVEAAIGRTFDRGDASGRADLVVLSDRLWRRSFDADPTIVGRAVRFVAGRADRGPKTFTVVGVLPRTFRFTYPLETEIWVIDPWSNIGRISGAITHTTVVARLQPTVSASMAQTRLNDLDDPIFRSRADPQYRTVSRVEPMADWITGDIRTPLWLVGGVAVLLLVITCATVANALFVRVATRRTDLAVRAALGAGRGRLVRQLLAEGASIAAMGTLVGTLFALLLLPAFRALLPLSIPRSDEIGVNVSWFAFAAVVATMSTLFAALAPAWGGARPDLATAVKGVSATSSADRIVIQWRRLLIGLQAAVAAALLTCAMLLLASFWRLTHMPLGFDAERVLTLETRVIDKKYRSADALLTFQESVLARVRAIPGVLQAGFTSAVPFRGVDWSMVLAPVGEGRRLNGNGRFVDSAYFGIMNIPLLRGRLMSETDTRTSPPVVVLSREFARGMFGTDDVVGREIDFGSPNEPKPVRVVGIVGETRYESYAEDPRPAVYLPRTQEPSELACVVALVAPDAGNLSAALSKAIRDVDPTVPAMNVTTIERILDESVADRRFYTAATTMFAGVALLLTAVGLVVVVSRAVVERRRELAVRVALGASAVSLQTLVIRQSLWPVVVGTTVGLAAASAGARLLTALLFQVDARSGVLYGGVALLVIVASAGAALVPAFTATRIAPADALKAE
jgi:putative ABC transport system permease protein